ncbi:unnamed protein product, partial [Medioppia subpectinata]
IDKQTVPAKCETNEPKQQSSPAIGVTENTHRYDHDDVKHISDKKDNKMDTNINDHSNDGLEQTTDKRQTGFTKPNLNLKQRELHSTPILMNNSDSNQCGLVNIAMGSHNKDNWQTLSTETLHKQSNPSIINADDTDDHVTFNDGNYKTQFIELEEIGSGGFGTVFKVKHRLDDKIYAVKRVQFGEVKNLVKLDSDFVVKYYNSWLEFNHLFIQMEFCSQNLKSVLKDKPIVFERQQKHHMNNHDINRHTASRYEHSIAGILRYMATEVLSGRQYNYKSDVYSLYLIGEELFGIDFQSSQSFEAKESVFKSCILCMCETLRQMMATVWRQRPECWPNITSGPLIRVLSRVIRISMKC